MGYYKSFNPNSSEFELLKSGKPLVVYGNYAFKDYNLKHPALKEKLIARCTSRFSGKSSFQIKY